MSKAEQAGVQYRDLAMGFHARRREPDAPVEAAAPGHWEAWEALAGVLGSCREGDFSGLPRLIDLMSATEGYLYRSAVVNVMGCAGGWGLIERFVAALDGAVPSHEAFMFGARTLSLSCRASAVGPLLRLYPRADGLESRLMVSHELSFLLEEGPGPIWGGADEEDPALGRSAEERRAVAVAQHLDLVRGRIAALEPAAPAGGTLFEGGPLDVLGTARRLLRRLGGEGMNKEWVFRESLVFGGATGVDCTHFWTRSYELRRLDAMAVVEEFLDGPEAARFVPGRRYFLGHPIPD